MSDINNTGKSTPLQCLIIRVMVNNRHPSSEQDQGIGNITALLTVYDFMQTAIRFDEPSWLDILEWAAIVGIEGSWAAIGGIEGSLIYQLTEFTLIHRFTACLKVMLTIKCQVVWGSLNLVRFWSIHTYKENNRSIEGHLSHTYCGMY